jgi:hypothetical protein
LIAERCITSQRDAFLILCNIRFPGWDRVSAYRMNTKR